MKPFLKPIHPDKQNEIEQALANATYDIGFKHFNAMFKECNTFIASLDSKQGKVNRGLIDGFLAAITAEFLFHSIRFLAQVASRDLPQPIPTDTVLEMVKSIYDHIVVDSKEGLN